MARPDGRLRAVVGSSVENRKWVKQMQRGSAWKHAGLEET